MLIRSPGRVNIIGEHTDYNDGFVLPTTTAAYTNVRAERRDDRIVRLASSNLDATGEFCLDDIEPADAPSWLDYARGVAVEIEAQGIRLGGANLDVSGDVPIGGGLSSSASFEVGVARALLQLSDIYLSAKTVARICQRAEIRFAGVNCGIMDQFTIAGCVSGRAMMIDCRSLEVDFVEIPSRARLLVIDSGVRHQLPESGYNERATECQDAVSILARSDKSVTALRDVSSRQVEAAQSDLGERLYRRARHIVTENQRVLAARDAMRADDLEKLGGLISQSHASQRDDFEISCAPVDRLVDIADACDGALGSRQVGGGFGGCIVCLTTVDHVETIGQRITTEYKKPDGGAPWLHVVSDANPAGPVNSADIETINL